MRGVGRVAVLADDLAVVVDVGGAAGCAAGEGAEVSHNSVLIEEGVSLAVGGGGFADDLAVFVDGVGAAGGAAREGAEVGDCAVLVEEGVAASAGGSSYADDLAVIRSEEAEILPANGVYATRVVVEESVSLELDYPSMM